MLTRTKLQTTKKTPDATTTCSAQTLLVYISKFYLGSWTTRSSQRSATNFAKLGCYNSTPLRQISPSRLEKKIWARVRDRGLLPYLGFLFTQPLPSHQTNMETLL